MATEYVYLDGEFVDAKQLQYLSETTLFCTVHLSLKASEHITIKKKISFMLSE